VKNILIVGFGLSGKSAAQFLISRGMNVIAVDDKRDEIAKSSSIEVFKDLPDGISFDYAVCSPGVPPTHPIIRQLNSMRVKIMSEVELAFDHIKNPIIGVTGTNGKTTVTLLTTHILNACGKKACALGNVGIPLTSAIDTLSSNEIVVAELSSYQLEDLKTPLLDSSVLLNITPDHLDRYHTMEKYAEAKMKLQKITKDPSRFFIDHKTYSEYGTFLKNSSVSTYGYGDQTFSTDLKGVFFDGNHLVDLPGTLQNKKNHDLENFLAAFALSWSMGANPKDIRSAYETFIKPHHRIEYIKELQGIKFYDDSKGTNIDAVIRAVESIKGSIHLIAGGVDKGSSYSPWITGFHNKVKKVYAIGQAAQKIHHELGNSIEVELYPTLQSAVTAAYQNAKAGENVLLSPGCASFDMFKDYVDRGLSFQKIIKTL
jgi:UDP-N-acetylmuramoylalanine--D-glutamate ligase